jgi:alkylation response protein AidB-like acyl-CoA dehydrogenase
MSSTSDLSDQALGVHELRAAAEAAISDALSGDLKSTASVLAGAGLTALLTDEAAGGLGLRLRDALVVAEAAGALQLRWPLVEQMVLSAALAGTRAGGEMARGERIGAVAWQGSLEEGIAGPARAINMADYLLVRTGEGAALLDRSSLELSEVAVLDPHWPEVWARWADQEPMVVARLDKRQSLALLHSIQLLCAAEVSGAARSALQRTAEHATMRVQFGGPLSARQAVRHQLARMQLRVELMSASIARVASADEFGMDRDSRSALAGVIEHGAFVLERAIHLHGAMGFTWDVPLHGALRAIRALDAAFGTRQALYDLGQRLTEEV